jgi:hypothetical protein
MIIWVKDKNYRVYVDKQGVKHGAPIHREYWQPQEVEAETIRSWILSDGTKVPKSTVFPTLNYAISKQQVDDICWLEENLYRINNAIQALSYGMDRYRNIGLVREVAKLIDYREAT